MQSINQSINLNNVAKPQRGYHIRVKFGGVLNLTVWRSVLEQPIIMSANIISIAKRGAGPARVYLARAASNELHAQDQDYLIS